MQTQTISVVSTKGGVGKTTLTANIAGYLHRLGHSVLMIDSDPQPSLSSYYQITHKSECGLRELCKDPSNINQCISQTEFGDLIYSNDPTNELQSWLLLQGDGRFRIKSAITKLNKTYDFVLIDTQGAKGALQDAAVLAAQKLISPIIPEVATVKEFGRGTLDMMRNLKTYQEMGIALPTLSGVVYKLDNTADAREFTHLLKASNNDQYDVLDTVVPQSVSFKEATRMHIPVTELSKGNRKQYDKSFKSVKAIKDLVRELRIERP